MVLYGLVVLATGVALAQSDFSGSGDAVSMAAGGTPDVYVVQPGDTLWEISSTFLGSAYYWPRLWSINDYITNPHWIYPGNRIVFRMGTLVEPPAVELQTVEPSREGYSVSGVEYDSVDSECGPDVRFTDTRDARIYEATGFLADKDTLDVYGTVAKARTMQTYLSEGDLIYLDVDDPESFECGDVVSVFRREKKSVRHPESHRLKYGSLYRVLGEAKITQIYGDVVAARVRQNWSEIERGDLVGPVIPVSVEVEVGPPLGDLDGTILDRVSLEASTMGTGETVFLDRGRADGLRVGNSFYIIDQRDENLDRKAEDESLPPSVVGRLVVVRVDEDSSTAVITDAVENLRVGAHVTMKLD